MMTVEETLTLKNGSEAEYIDNIGTSTEPRLKMKLDGDDGITFFLQPGDLASDDLLGHLKPIGGDSG